MFIIGLIFVVSYILIRVFADHLRFFCDKRERFLYYLDSFASGSLIAALLLVFLQEVYTIENALPYVCIVAISFTIFFWLHLSVKRTHEHDRKVCTMISSTQIVFEILHSFLIGVVFAHISQGMDATYIWIFFPLLFSEFVSAYLRSEQVVIKSYFSRTTEHIATAFIVVGYLLGYTVMFSSVFFYGSLAFVAGGIFYVVVSLVLARKRISIGHMIAGQVLYGLLVLAPYLF